MNILVKIGYCLSFCLIVYFGARGHASGYIPAVAPITTVFAGNGGTITYFSRIPGTVYIILRKVCDLRDYRTTGINFYRTDTTIEPIPIQILFSGAEVVSWESASPDYDAGTFDNVNMIEADQGEFPPLVVSWEPASLDYDAGTFDNVNMIEADQGGFPPSTVSDWTSSNVNYDAGTFEYPTSTTIDGGE